LYLLLYIEDLQISYNRSSGPGGQNVNKGILISFQMLIIIIIINKARQTELRNKIYDGQSITEALNFSKIVWITTCADLMLNTKFGEEIIFNLYCI